MLTCHGCISLLVVPDVDLDKGPTFVEKNKAVTLPKCHATGSPTPEVKWSKVGGSLPAQSEVEDGQLKIVNATKQDAGLYKCEATNSVGSDEAETSVVLIEFVKPPEVLNTTLGADERIKCCVTTKPELQSVKWVKSKRELTALTDGTLELTNVQEVDGGKYVCNVLVGKLTFVAEMKLHIVRKYRDKLRWPVSDEKAFKQHINACVYSSSHWVVLLSGACMAEYWIRVIPSIYFCLQDGVMQQVQQEYMIMTCDR